jgi:AbrB family looped-hinge helix DNA binding protein
MAKASRAVFFWRLAATPTTMKGQGKSREAVARADQSPAMACKLPMFVESGVKCCQERACVSGRGRPTVRGPPSWRKQVASLTSPGNTNHMRITTKGQVTIPQEIRTELGLLPNTEVTFDIVDGEARIRKATRKSKRLSRGDGVLAHLRSIRPSNKLTTNEIMSLMRGKP